MTEQFRFNRFVDKARGYIVIRPIGYLSGAEYIERTLEFYRSLGTPWVYNRIIDMRRYEGVVTSQNRADLAAAWGEITSGVDYRTHVAMVMQDPRETLHNSSVSAECPSETVCVFCDYHQAVGWVLSSDRKGFLKSLASPAPKIPASHLIDAL